MKSTKLGARTWAGLVIFGLVGQIAWVVENMYFATLCQDIYSLANRVDLGYIFTTVMVIFSALTATITTFVAGALSDKIGKRKPFIRFGYIVWGITIMIFALIPMHVAPSALILTGIALVVCDCIMTVAGSTANDAALNAWVTDITDTTNRGIVNAIMSLMPVFAVIIVFIALGNMYSVQNASNAKFFIILGAMPLVAGFLSSSLIMDSNKINKTHTSDIFYGFRKNVIAENKMLYISLLAFSIIAISQQTFFSYLINFLSITLGFGNGFIVPMATILLGSAVGTTIFGILFDKYGRKHFYILLCIMVVLGTLSFYILKFIESNIIIYIGGLIMMTGIFSLSSAIMANFQDLIPSGYEGRFQGIRMCFTVLVPMIVGPIISLIIGLGAENINTQGFAPTHNIFLAAAIVAIIALIPILKLRRG